MPGDNKEKQMENILHRPIDTKIPVTMCKVNVEKYCLDCKGMSDFSRRVCCYSESKTCTWAAAHFLHAAHYGQDHVLSTSLFLLIFSDSSGVMVEPRLHYNSA